MKSSTSLPVRHCEVCGIQLALKRRQDGSMESKTEFMRRHTCSQKCYLKWLSQHPHKISEKTLSLMHERTTNRMLGCRFGKVVVLSRVEDYISPKGQTHAKYLCKCDCGREFIARGCYLRLKKNATCLACSRKIFGMKHAKHGFSHKEPLYTTWKGIRERCNNPNQTHHDLYYDKGIRVCDKWNDYAAFRKWALENGWVHGLTIDRINSAKGYSPDNCRVVTMKENNENRTIGRNKDNGQYISIRNNKGL